MYIRSSRMAVCNCLRLNPQTKQGSRWIALQINQYLDRIPDWSIDSVEVDCLWLSLNRAFFLCNRCGSKLYWKSTAWEIHSHIRFTNSKPQAGFKSAASRLSSKCSTAEILMALRLEEVDFCMSATWVDFHSATSKILMILICANLIGKFKTLASTFYILSGLIPSSFYVMTETYLQDALVTLYNGIHKYIVLVLFLIEKRKTFYWCYKPLRMLLNDHASRLHLKELWIYILVTSFQCATKHSDRLSDSPIKGSRKYRQSQSCTSVWANEGDQVK